MLTVRGVVLGGGSGNRGKGGFKGWERGPSKGGVVFLCAATAYQ